jgi:hypothetical protein
MADRWYYLGKNSFFDSDMDISEMIDNYFNRGTKIDLDTYYYYLLSKLSSYWVKFLELESIKTEEDLWNLYNTKDSARKNIIVKTWDKVKKLKEKDYGPFYQSILGNVKEGREKVEKENDESNRRKLIKTIFESFLKIGNLFCGSYSDDPTL